MKISIIKEGPGKWAVKVIIGRNVARTITHTKEAADSFVSAAFNHFSADPEPLADATTLEDLGYSPGRRIV